MEKRTPGFLPFIIGNDDCGCAYTLFTRILPYNLTRDFNGKYFPTENSYSARGMCGYGGV